VKKSLISILVIALFASMSPAQAATKTSTVIAAFKTFLDQTEDSLQALQEKNGADLAILASTLAKETLQANQIYDSKVNEASALYSPQISKLKESIQLGLSKYNASNEIEFLSIQYFKGWGFWFDCAAKLPTCGNDDEEYRFYPGDRVKTRNGETVNMSPITFVEEKVANGQWRLLNPTDFQAAAVILRNDPKELKRITTEFDNVNVTAEENKNMTINQITTQISMEIKDLKKSFEIEREKLSAQEVAAKLAILAAKRANKDPSIFDAAFVVAYKFEYNRRMLGEIADASWTGKWTFRTIDSILKVNKLAATGDSISARYSRTTAAAFNSAVGNAFTNEPDFRAVLKVLNSIYKKTTNTTLRF